MIYGCEYNRCGKKVFCTENITGTEMKLCMEHFRHLFWKIIKDAEVVDKTGDDEDEKTNL